MAKSVKSYSRTRFNALKFGTHAEGPVPCFGSATCPHRYCEGVYTPPLEGSPCPFEAEYARRLEAEFRDRYEMLTILDDVDDFEDLVTEYVNVYLKRGRAMTKLNRGWDKRDSDGRLLSDAWREFDLADLYLDRLSRREERLQAKLEEGLDRMRQRAKRLRPHLQMIELFVAGKQAAIDEAQGPQTPIWDEFADGSGSS